MDREKLLGIARQLLTGLGEGKAFVSSGQALGNSVAGALAPTIPAFSSAHLADRGS
ncbi:MAG: hypothetical protein ABSF64_31815 [Bryobacteraceae bacterium]|jgi:hypothetical protein